MLTWVFFGFLLGLQHALEADHIAAVASLTADKKGVRNIIRHGAVWGLGHALVLGAFGGAVYALELTLSGRLASGLEFAVGIMMVLLGARLLYVLLRDRVHFHTHRHGAENVHFHAHSHAGDVKNHALSRHGHAHPAGGWRRSLAVGMMHGLAGSAALVALAASTAPSIPLGVAFILLFGLGSIAGMALFSAVIAVPLSYTAMTLTWATRGFQALAGLFAIAIGLHTLVETGTVLFG
ncbi:urease accessory protein [Aestuariivirga litoralis]|uniref:Urease accessory protein n=1 Tax=Aestuariivirga litoralis TaxID=2650924 RepID=A0A2W2AQ89_9HYPH|nr:urease accessory protein [Aestuariivirga litoralis]PZF75762.1 urease accessory protein [Aestuariivirga litoralis]